MFDKVARMMTLAGILMTGVALAQEPAPPPMAAAMNHVGHGGGPGEHHGPMGMMLPGVTLTMQQKAQMRAIFQAAHHEHVGGRGGEWKQIRGLDQQIGDVLMADGKVDRAKLDDLLKQKDAMMERHRDAWVDTAIKVHDILTPGQLVQARATRAKLTALHEQEQALIHPDKGPDKGDDAPMPE